MSRDYFLELADRGHRFPIGVDVVLHRHPDHADIVLDGGRLGGVMIEAAREFSSPLGLPLMDLTLEKMWMLALLGVPREQAGSHHFSSDPGANSVALLEDLLRSKPPPPRIAANLAALRQLAAAPNLLPVGMSIGPFSLATKLLADPITPVYFAGTGASPEEEPEVAVLERALALALTVVLRSVALQLEAGARAMFIAEPAANLVFFSPRQLETGSDIFERFALRPNRAVASLLEKHGVDLLFHCCGEITDGMLDGFCSLRPALLSLGSSRRLWEDAERVPKDIVLYGNLPSKRFYSDELLPLDMVGRMAGELEARMHDAGHPFILGTECDTLHVDGFGETINEKLLQILNPIPPVAAS